jgi:hypothetical protein
MDNCQISPLAVFFREDAMKGGIFMMATDVVAVGRYASGGDPG